MGLFSFITKALPVANFLGDIFGASQGAHSANEANKTNIKLARENRDWQAEMDNTAVQRRVADIRAAGGNPALAFTGGQSASTPAVASPTVEPTFRPEWTKGTAAQALMFKAQLDNIQAQTANTAAQARVNNVEASIREKSERSELERRVKENVERFDQAALKTGIMRHQQATSAAERRRIEQSVDLVVKELKQQVRKDEIDLAALERIAQIGGVDATKAASLVRMIIDFIKLGKD